MCIIEVFRCECCHKEFRDFVSERNKVSLEIAGANDSTSFKKYRQLAHITDVCNECADQLNASIIEVANRRRQNK